MLATRAPLLSRAIAQMARNGNRLTVATVKNSKQLQLQPVRFSGHWTYRTGTTTIPLYKRVWGQTMCACKWLNLNLTDFVWRWTDCNCFWFLPLGAAFISYVVVDSLAFVLGLGPHCRRIWISRYIKMDRRRTWNSTWRWGINEWLWNWKTYISHTLHARVLISEILENLNGYKHTQTNKYKYNCNWLTFELFANSRVRNKNNTKNKEKTTKKSALFLLVL